MAQNTNHLPGDAGAVVLGGGVAGLTAACYLARAGERVTIFERASELGGRAATQQLDGYALNRGAHALYTGGAATEILRELGVTYRAAVPRHVFGLVDGRFYPLPTSPAGMLSGRLLGLSGTLALVRLFARLGRIDARSLGTTSVQQWLDAEVHHPRLRLLMDAFARTFVYSAALDLVSADVFVDKLQRSLKHPIHYVEGGWQTLVDGLRCTAEAAGARVVTGTRVEAVLQQGGKVTGVRTRDGEMVAASSVVVATTPQDVAALLDGEFPALQRTLDALVPARLACVDVALRALPRPEHPVVLELERPLFMTAQSRYIPVAPRGAALIHTFKLLDPRHEAPTLDDERALEGLLDAAQPGWRDALAHQVSLPRILAVGALPLARSGGFAGRPGPEVPGLAGLYLAGDWVGAEGFLVDASFASARQAARLALAQRQSARQDTPRPRRRWHAGGDPHPSRRPRIAGHQMSHAMRTRPV